MDQLLHDIRACTICEKDLDPRPVVSVHAKSKILVVGQAPGLAVHRSGVPWDDKSGENLRAWLGVTQADFYNPEYFGIVPMGFCYPGKGTSGDKPPRPKCATTWHQRLLEQMPEVHLTLLIGQYAQRYYLQEGMRDTLTETVRNYQEYLPEYFVLPHPSPRNNIWQARNAWFPEQVLSDLKQYVARCLL